VSDAARISVLLVALAVLLAAHVRRRGEEYEPDERPTTTRLLLEVLRSNPVAVVLTALYVVVVVVAESTGVLVAAAACAVVVAGSASRAQRVFRNRGIERDQFLMAASITFLVLMTLCGVWAMFEHLAEAPRISMVVPWGVGLVVWIGAETVLRRRAA